MPKPEEAAYIPTFDETKLGKTQFRRLMDLHNEAKAQIDQLEEAVAEYRSQMSALMLKHRVDKARVEGLVAQWVPAGKPGRKIVPALVLAALGGNKAKFDKCHTATEPRAAYFKISGKNEEPEE